MTITAATVLETLENCRSLVIECQQISRLIEAVILPGARGCASPRIGGAPSGAQSAGDRMDTYEKWLLRDQAEAAIQIIRVQEMADTLPKELADPLRLYYADALPQVVVAERLGIAQGTVSARLVSAVDRLEEENSERD